MTRRSFLSVLPASAVALAQPARKARIAITYDLEMSRNFPTWEATHWDYEKGNLDSDSKRYALDAARLVRDRGGRIHFFAVGRVFEQQDVSWLEEIAKTGHAVGNHTYDHVNVLARKLDDVQFRFKRAPWLLRGATPAEAIADNIKLCTNAMKSRLGIAPNGFRTPGGFAGGLNDRADVQRLLAAQGFNWISSKYPRHPIDITAPARYLPEPLKAAQPYKYPETGLTEIPMSPVSDINAFRNGRWPLPKFLDAIRYALDWTIENRAVFDLLVHPSCIGVMDPRLETMKLICSRVEAAKNQAELTTLDQVAASV